jgi:formylglycine-generating enzyme required for sulfatase activity
LKRVERTRNVEQFLALLQSNAFPEIEKPPSKVAIKKEPEIFSLIEKKQKVRNPIRKDRAQSSTHRFVKPDPTSDSTHERRIDQFIEPELIRIPAGEFLMGSDKNIDQDTLDDEIPQHRMVLPEFWIGRYPVTNVEYQKFLLANPKQSTLEGWNGREYPIEKERHPVVNVTWYEAYAYCRWLTSIIGKQFVLPSEAEWEKAARGTDGRIYPWGIEWDSKRCNTSEKGPSMTTPVGMYTTKGDSPYGCSDMAGNVWQWTRSLFNQEKYPYPYTPNDGRESLTHQREIARVLRGGSFNLGSNYARCASRDWNSPGSRIWSYGFRVVYSPTFFQNSERRIS